MKNQDKKSCVFCDFDRRFILEENSRAFAAYFDCAVKPGHIVAALKEHVTSLSRLTPEQAADLMTLAARVADRAGRMVGCEKFYLVSIADETPHYHLHLLPKMPGGPPLGPHVMGASGWRGAAGAPVGEDSIHEFISRYRSENGLQS